MPKRPLFIISLYNIQHAFIHVIYACKLCVGNFNVLSMCDIWVIIQDGILRTNCEVANKSVGIKK